MKILIDTNIILDYLLERKPFLEDAEMLFQAIDFGQIIGYVTATTLTDIFYMFTKSSISFASRRSNSRRTWFSR